MIGLVVCLLSTVAALPLVLALLRRARVIDVPNQRSSHSHPVPRGGGLACLVGLLAGTAVVQTQSGGSLLWRLVGLVVVAALVGLLDDLGSIPAVPRLAAQLGLGLVAGTLIGHSVLWAFAGAIAFALSVNVVNFMDGIDGITGLTIGLWGLSAMVVATRDHAHNLFVIAALTAACALGFLPANLPQARLFMGDVGSYLLGALVGAGLLVGYHEGVALSQLLAPLSLYLVDVVTTLVGRAARGRPLMSAHRDHVYQRLVADGRLSHPVVATYVTALSAAITVSCLLVPGWYAIAITTVLLSGYLFSVRALEWRHSPALRPTVLSGA
jgi:UDP-GlcNAc:undecaprenyl-phosphate/decaprenyl-phosphate GlcNAc-1-phosphate transferase